MTKIRHRTFEIFDVAEAAEDALASKAARSDLSTQSWSLRQLLASQSAGIVHLTFANPGPQDAEAVNGLREDFSELAKTLVNGSRVLLDFEGLLEFDSESIVDLENLSRKLQMKGSRIVLCNLSPVVQASFFPHRSTT